MNIRLAGLSIFISALFAIPVAVASPVSSADDTSIRQGAAGKLIVADAHQHRGDHQSKKEGKGEQNQGHAGHSGGHKHKHGGSKHGGHKHGHQHSHAHNIILHAEVLDLSDEQIGKIVRLHLKDTQEHDRIKQKMREGMKAFRKAIVQPATDDATLRKLGQAHIDDFNTMIKHHLEERKAVNEILTPEQFEKLKTLKADHDGGHDH